MRVRVVTVLVAALGLAARSASAQNHAIVFQHVAVIPMDRERVMIDQTVVVRGDHIVAIGPARKVRVPTGATRIDGRGKFLIPGLADMHVHVPGLGWSMKAWQEQKMSPAGLTDAERMLTMLVANGVTTVRLMYGWPDNGTLVLRERAAKHELLSPRIYAAAGPLEEMREGNADPVRFVETAKAAGYDFVKLHGVGGTTFDSIVSAAHRVGIPVAGHAPSDGYEKALRAHYVSVEHLTGVVEAVKDTGARENGSLDDVKLRALAVATQQAGVWHCPTLLLVEQNAGVFTNATQVLARPEMRYFADSMLRQMRSQGDQDSSRDSAAQAAEASARLAAQHEIAALWKIVRTLHDAGVGLLLGTDTGVPGIVAGFAVHHELGELVRAGLTPYQALATGTSDVARFLGTLDQTGTVAVGKRADLVLLAGNPLRDIRHTSEIAGVMLGGRWLPRTELDTRLKLIEGTLSP